MLKRNGEVCEHGVPDYPGLLTDSELNAYKTAFPSVEGMLREFNEGATALANVEKKAPQIVKQAAENTVNGTEIITIRGQDTTWQVKQILHKSARNELLFCSRDSGEGTQFGIVERFAPKSLYAQVHGNTDLLLTSNQPSLLLQDHLENEKRILEMFRTDIQATVEETLAEKFPGENYGRVVKAISARCKTRAAGERQNTPSEKQGKNVRIRF